MHTGGNVRLSFRKKVFACEHDSARFRGNRRPTGAAVETLYLAVLSFGLDRD